MQNLSRLFIALYFLTFIHVKSTAQIVQDPTSWNFEIKKKGEHQYDLITHLKLAKDWHIWSMKPGGDGMLIAPKLTLDKNKEIELIGNTKESGKMKSEEYPGVDGITHFYENEVTYTQNLKIKNNTKIKGNFFYQTCDHSQCLAPKAKDFYIEVKDIVNAPAVKDSVPAKEVINPSKDSVKTAVHNLKDAAAATILPITQLPADSYHTNMPTIDAQPKDHRSNMALLLEGIFGGLISIITPCVFAMLPMTVSFFLKRSKDKKSGIKVALQYSLSLVIIFGLLGLVLSLVNNGNILYEFSTHWITNLVFFVMFIVFAFSFLGAFELTLPSKWSTAADSKANMNSLSGIFFMALTLAIVSFSCTAPFLGGLISEISKGARTGPFIGFLGYGLGLALPFTLFAIFPQLLSALNKQGGWLNAVKVTFGFIELALAFKFLSNADLQKGWRLIDREIFIAIWTAISLALSFYLFGFIRFSHDSELPKNHHDLPYLTVTRTLFGLSALIFALYLIPGMWGAPLNGMGAFVPPMGTQDFVLNSGGNIATVEASKPSNEAIRFKDKMKIYEPEAVKKYGLEAYFDYHQAIEVAKREKKPIMLDFTGITCVNCRKMETQVWSNPEVLKRLKEDFVLVSLYCDANQVELPENERYESKFLGKRVGNLGEKNSDIQATKFNANTQPYYFYIDENEKLLADKGYGYDPDIQKFTAHLDAVKAKYKALNP